MRRSWGHRGAVFASVLVAALVLFSARDARADFDFQLTLGVNGGWLRKTPSLSTPAPATSARAPRTGELPMRGGMTTLGPYVDLSLTIDDRWSVPLVGGGVYWAIGSYDSVVTSFDGSIAEVRPWSAFRGDFLLPGIGRRFKHRRNMVSIGARTGVSFVILNGSVAAGADSTQINLAAVTFLLQAEIEGCRRLDPSTRVCAFVAPRLYEYQFLSGFMMGLRMEWGR